MRLQRRRVWPAADCVCSCIRRWLNSLLFDGWLQWLNLKIRRSELEAASTGIRQAFGAKLEWAIDLGTCRALSNSLAVLWTFLAHPDLELTNNPSERALRPGVIARKLSSGVQSAWGGQFVARIMTVATSLEQQGRDSMAFTHGADECPTAPRKPPATRQPTFYQA
jgi:hypothetical protein